MKKMLILFVILKLIYKVISPNCLSVDNAIFFMSFSYIALILVVKDVNIPIIISIVCIILEDEAM